ncbi:MAG: hypothetical protein AB8H80_20745 [Planctomycetota bacterium]
MFASILALLALGGPSAPAPAFHSIAFVTDPLSHGVLGDNLLSLNEAIQLHNGTLLASQLSATEQIQVSLLPGSGTTDLTWIEIDTELVQTITVEQDLDVIVDTPFGLFIRGSGGRATIDFSGANVTRGMLSTSNSLILQGLRFSGGPYGLDVTQSDITGQPGCTMLDVSFEDQAQFAVRVRGTLAGGIGRLIVEDCDIDNTPRAIEFDETVADRSTIFEARDVRITGTDTAFDMSVGTGGNARFTFDRCVIESTNIGIEIDAPSTSGRPLLVEGTHTRVRAPICARIDGASDAVTWMQCSMWNLLAGNGGTALAVGSVGDQVYGDLNEFRCTGDVAVATGGAPLPLSMRNARCRDGAVTLSTTASQAFTVTESRFQNCTTESVGTAAVNVDGSSFEGGSVGSTSQAGLLQATGCYISNPGPGVTETQTLPQAHLGSMTVAPDDTLLGGTIQLDIDLPAGLVGAFVLGTRPAVLPALPAPYYVYLDLNEYVFLPGAFVGQQSTTWTAPNSLLLRGIDLIAQAAVLPLTAPAPPVQLPPGWRFELR